MRARSICGGGIVELQAVGVDAVNAANDFGAEQLRQGVNVGSLLEPDNEFVGDDLGLADVCGDSRSHQLRSVLHRRAEDEQPGTGIGVRHEREVHITQQHVQRLAGRQVLEFGRDLARDVGLDIDVPAGLSGDLLQELVELTGLDIGADAVRLPLQAVRGENGRRSHRKSEPHHCQAATLY